MIFIYRQDWIYFPNVRKYENFWMNPPVRPQSLRSSSTYFLIIAILEFSNEGINFITTVVFCNKSDYAAIFWFDD